MQPKLFPLYGPSSDGNGNLCPLFWGSPNVTLENSRFEGVTPYSEANKKSEPLKINVYQCVLMSLNFTSIRIGLIKIFFIPLHLLSLVKIYTMSPLVINPTLSSHMWTHEEAFIQISLQLVCA